MSVDNFLQKIINGAGPRRNARPNEASRGCGAIRDMLKVDGLLVRGGGVRET